MNPRCRVQKKAVEWMPQNLYAAAAPISKSRWWKDNEERRSGCKKRMLG